MPRCICLPRCHGGSLHGRRGGTRGSPEDTLFRCNKNSQLVTPLLRGSGDSAELTQRLATPDTRRSRVGARRATSRRTPRTVRVLKRGLWPSAAPLALCRAPCLRYPPVGPPDDGRLCGRSSLHKTPNPIAASPLACSALSDDHNAIQLAGLSRAGGKGRNKCRHDTD